MAPMFFRTTGELLPGDPNGARNDREAASR